MLELGHDVTLLGAPGSTWPPGVDVLDVPADRFDSWAAGADVDVVHDHSNGLIAPEAITQRAAFLSTHHLTGPPRYTLNCTYVSAAQRGSGTGPVVPLPVDPAQHRFRSDKDDYLLFLGRVSPHKGVYEAAAFAAAAGTRLVVAGPAWEPDYVQRIESDFGDVVERVGEVASGDRAELISRARAILVLSQPVTGPWGHLWCEPGATVVSEAAISGTPVVATRNGCLPDLVPGVGALVDFGAAFTPREAEAALSQLPNPAAVRDVAARRWHYRDVARRYEALYRQVLAGERWGHAPSASHAVTSTPGPT